MRTFIHGTSFESIENIRINGFLNNPFDRTWNVSDDRMLYLRELTIEDPYEDPEEALRYCIENGQITAAFQGSLSTTIGIIRLDIDDTRICIDDYIEPDDSCEGMDDCFEIMVEDLVNLINEGIITVYFNYHENSYIPYLRPFYLKGLNKEYLNDIEDSTLLYTIDILSNTDIFIDEMLEMESEPSESIPYQCVNEMVA